jgi:hypothetical protein
MTKWTVVIMCISGRFISILLGKDIDIFHDDYYYYLRRVRRDRIWPGFSS